MSENKLTKLPLDAVFCWATALVSSISGFISLKYGFSAMTLLIVLAFIAIGVFAFMKNRMLVTIGLGVLTLLRFVQLILSFTYHSAPSIFINLFYFAATALLLVIVLSRSISQLRSLESSKGILKFLPSGLHLLGLIVYLISTLINYIAYLRYGYGFGFFLRSFLPAAFGAIISGAVVIAAYFFIANNAFEDVYQEGGMPSFGKQTNASAAPGYQPILQPDKQPGNYYAPPAAPQGTNPYAAPQGTNPYAAPQGVNPYAPPQPANPYAAPQNVNPYAPPAAPAQPEFTVPPIVPDQTGPIFAPEAPEQPEPAAPSEAVAPEAAPFEVPSFEVPAMETPAFEAPAQDVIAPEAPAFDAPAEEVPAAVIPEVEVPAAEIPEAVVPDVEIPEAEVSDVEVPVAEAPAEEAAEAPAEAISDDIVSTLKSFKTLLDQGLITQEEYDAKKKQILGL